MKLISLFAGIGGFDLAAEWMGWETIVQVEIDDWCRKVLAKNFPNAIRHDDIKTFDATSYAGTIDLICGGFPCQPFSHAGQRKGEADDRALWPEMLRVIREVAPRWVVGENVSGLLTQSAGLVFESMCVDLEAEGYTVWPYLLPACGVNAPHKRERVWIIAYRDDRQRKPENGKVRTGRNTPCNGSKSITTDTDSRFRSAVSDLQPGQSHFEGSATADASGTGCEERNAPGLAARPEYRTGASATDWSDWPTQPPVCSGNDGFSGKLDRNRTIKAAGNAVVPQLVYRLFWAIDQVENQAIGMAMKGGVAV